MADFNDAKELHVLGEESSEKTHFLNGSFAKSDNEMNPGNENKPKGKTFNIKGFFGSNTGLSRGNSRVEAWEEDRNSPVKTQGTAKKSKPKKRRSSQKKKLDEIELLRTISFVSSQSSIRTDPESDLRERKGSGNHLRRISLSDSLKTSSAMITPDDDDDESFARESGHEISTRRAEVPSLHTHLEKHDFSQTSMIDPLDLKERDTKKSASTKTSSDKNSTPSHDDEQEEAKDSGQQTTTIVSSVEKTLLSFLNPGKSEKKKLEENVLVKPKSVPSFGNLDRLKEASPTGRKHGQIVDILLGKTKLRKNHLDPGVFERRQPNVTRNTVFPLNERRDAFGGHLFAEDDQDKPSARGRRKNTVLARRYSLAEPSTLEVGMIGKSGGGAGGAGGEIAIEIHQASDRSNNGDAQPEGVPQRENPKREDIREMLQKFDFSRISKINEEKADKILIRRLTGAHPDRVKGFALWGKAILTAKFMVKLNALSHEVKLFGSKQLTKMRAQTYSQARIPPFLFTPEDEFKKLWTMVVILLLIYTATIMPYRICFVEEVELDWLVGETIIDGLFFVDLLINFFSSYYEGNQLVTNRKQIAVNYLKGWFIIDVIATIPFQLITELATEQDDSESSRYNKAIRLARVPRLYRMLRILRLIKMARIIKYNSFLQKIYQYLRINSGVSRMIQFTVTVLLCVHIISCFWYFTARLNDFEPDTWVAMHGYVDESNFTLYMISVYWSLSTLTTVGFGDVTAHNNLERAVSIFWILFGVGFYSFTISNLSTIMSNMDTRESLLQARLTTLRQFSKETKLSEELTSKIRRFVEHNHSENIYAWIDKDQLLSELPYSLRNEVQLYLHSNLIKKVPFLQRKSTDFVAFIIPLLKSMRVHSLEILYRAGDVADEMYFITSGRVGLQSHRGGVFISYVEGSYFGEIELFMNITREHTAESTAECELLLLNKQDLVTVAFEFPEAIKEMKYTAAIKREKNIGLQRHTDTIQERRAAILDLNSAEIDVDDPNFEVDSNGGNSSRDERKAERNQTWTTMGAVLTEPSEKPKTNKPSATKKATAEYRRATSLLKPIADRSTATSSLTLASLGNIHKRYEKQTSFKPRSTLRTISCSSSSGSDSSEESNKESAHSEESLDLKTQLRTKRQSTDIPKQGVEGVKNGTEKHPKLKFRARTLSAGKEVKRTKSSGGRDGGGGGGGVTFKKKKTIRFDVSDSDSEEKKRKAIMENFYRANALSREFPTPSPGIKRGATLSPFLQTSDSQGMEDLAKSIRKIGKKNASVKGEISSMNTNVEILSENINDIDERLNGFEKSMSQVEGILNEIREHLKAKS